MPTYIDKSKFIISDKEVIDSWNFLKKQLKNNQLVKKLEDENEETIREELQYIKTHSPCKTQYLQRLNYNISSLNSNELGKLLTSEFYNPTVMKSMQCVVNSTTDEGFYTSGYEKGFSSIDRERLHLQNLHVLSDSSANGVVYLTDYDGVKNAEIVIKESMNGGDGNDLAHEAFVGLYALNNLRAIIPNFMYTYAIVKGGAFIPTDKRALAFFNKKNKQTYHLLAENIPQAKSFASILATCNNKEFISYYMQVMYALEIAQNSYGFTHYDLHNENVLIARKNTKTHQILYQRPNGEERYVETNAVATIIDFGSSLIKLNGETYSNRLVPYSSNLPNNTHPLFDAYKLLGFLSYEYLSVKNKDPQLVETMLLMWNIFNPNSENIVESIEQQRDTYFEYLKVTTATLSDYINILEEELGIKKQYMTKKDLPFFDCEDNNCSNQQKILTLEGLNKFKMPRDVISMVELYRYVEKNPSFHKNFDIKALLYDFVETTNFKKSYSKLLQNTDKMSEYLSKIHKMSNKILNFDANILTQNVNYYNDFIINYLEQLKTITEINFNLKILYFYYKIIDENSQGDLDEITEYTEIVYIDLKDNNSRFFNDFVTFADKNRKNFNKRSWLAKNYLAIRDLLL